MKIDASLGKDISATKAGARAIEDAGYDGMWIGETKHDPFLQALHAVDATDTSTVGTAIAIAFARTPMTLANSAYDLARYSRGRFVLGLGSQVRPHIERRFSMPWSHPAPRMREFVLALKAIWAAWQDGTPLDFRGDFYTHTLMTPFFAPPAHEFGPPPVFVAGVGEVMTEVAGEVADGFFVHPFTTRRYLDEVTLPALERGRAKTGKTPEGFAVCGPSFVTVGRDERELATAVKGTKDQIAFYASTPAYRPVLDVHGWGDLQPELTRLSKQGRWSEMGKLITDEMLHEFSVVGTPADVAKSLSAKLAAVSTRVSFYATYESDPAVWPEVLAALR
ncbi:MULTISPECIES: LLM class F420-dependent oxidoreductase [unclassified Pseudofrankia]|uniref:LLM class F420-dependent oxidoreductase n=1 Tax=unclassified Pseudofrankia TaxID=2994372 RepID=UPI0008D8FE02|nr:MULTISPECIES: LLM class F420-dependent oxidoreductase [unclassified Pseudofrankia]MDT3441940.1 LLM class F420-dependent oxidoreductase [Pseudofrankia sp. BMG5.37]OHV44579.1 LLM class F420-dependent oxidoreductase [Pseudofrankia sp. BMG5.36]